MNIVTQELLKRIRDRRLSEFVSHWDNLEALVIRIYRTNFATEEDREAYDQLRDWLSVHYPAWQAALRSCWQGVRSAGEIIQSDPFMEILEVKDARDFASSWHIMQLLPAAREALNNLLLSIIESSPPL